MGILFGVNISRHHHDMSEGPSHPTTQMPIYDVHPIHRQAFMPDKQYSKDHVPDNTELDWTHPQVLDIPKTLLNGPKCETYSLPCQSEESQRGTQHLPGMSRHLQQKHVTHKPFSKVSPTLQPLDLQVMKYPGSTR
jgi:hypothetical protein